MKAEPKCKICRREGRSLCLSAKCALLKRKYPPGMHGHKGYPRLSEYGRQLREKQSLKRLYLVSEKQFKNYFAQARKKEGNTEENFLRFLEKRLDNVVYRSGFVTTRRWARQMVSHGLIRINDRRLDIPSYQVKIGDIISLKDKPPIIKAIKERLASKSKTDRLPAWINLDIKTLQIKILAEPKIEDLSQEFETELILAFYSR